VSPTNKQLNSYLLMHPGVGVSKQTATEVLGAKGKLVLVLLLHLKRLQPLTTAHNAEVVYVPCVAK
jgi:hypothetical protein